MSDDPYKDRILIMARQCAVEGESDSMAARRRGWLGPDDAPTQEGRTLIDELDDQEGARSVFRNGP